MELETVKQKVFLWIGWLSVVIGLVSLAILNIFLLWGYDIPVANMILYSILLTPILGVISAVNKKSRPLGLWGLGIAIYMGVYIVVIFFLGWIVSPFP